MNSFAFNGRGNRLGRVKEGAQGHAVGGSDQRGDGSDAGLLLSPVRRPPGSSACARVVAVLSLTLVHVF